MLNNLRLRLRALFFKSNMEEELDAEVRFHLEREIEENIARGMSPEEARLAALRSFGGVVRVKEESRDERGIRYLEEIWQDLRYGARMLSKNPGFTMVAAITLALGIGANTAIFSVLYSVLLNPLPYPDPDRIVRIWQAAPADGYAQLGMTEAQFFRLRAENQSFQQFGGYTLWRGADLAGETETERIRVAHATAAVFETLGVQPAIGRVFRQEEELAGSQAVALLSHGLWQRRFAGDASIIGRTVHLDDNPVTIIGVMPPDFMLPEEFSTAEGIGVWQPLRIDPAKLRWGGYNISPIARLKPGVRPEQALAEVNTVFARLRQERPEFAIKELIGNTNVRLLHEDLVGDVRKTLWILVAAVAVVLAVACANVSSLLLARSAGRQKEIAVRAALGAGRGRLVRQLLTESMLIALLGGAVGVGFALFGIELIARSNLVNVPRLAMATLNGVVLLFTTGVCILATFLFGLIPSVQVSQIDLNRSLREEGRGLAGSAGRNRTHRVLVISEVALAVVLVIAAGLLLRSFERLLRIDPGFEPKNLLTVSLNLSAASYQDNARVIAFYDQLVERAQGLPGVTAAAATSGLPLTGPSGDEFFHIEGRPASEPNAPPDRRSGGHLYCWQVTPGYFNAMGIPLRRGRTLQPSDSANTPLVVVINETMARSFWPNEDPIGERIQILKGSWLEIVGVVGNVAIRQLNEESQPEVYLTQSQSTLAGGGISRHMALTVRTTAEPLQMAEAVRREVRTLDRMVPIIAVRTAEQLLEQTVSRQRFNLMLLGLFAIVTLGLAAVGIYGLLTNAVRIRNREIGVRLALGARPDAMFRLIVLRGMTLATIGIALGLGAAFMLTGYLETLLYEVKPTDPLTFAGVAALLLATAFLACFIPARRATKVDPLIALRAE